LFINIANTTAICTLTSNPFWALCR